MERLRGCGGRVGTTVTSRVSVSGSIVGTQHVRGPLPMRQQPPRGLASGQSGHTDRLCHLAVRCAAVGSRASSGGGSGGSSSSSGGSGGSGSASNSAIGSSGPGSQRGELLGWASRASRDLSLVKSPLPFFAPTLGKPPDTLGFLGSIDENDASAADMNPSMGWRTLPHHLGKAELWARMCDEARADKAAEPSHASILHSTILSHASFESSLSALLSNKLGSDKIGAVALFSLFQQVYREEPDIVAAAIADLLSVKDRDPACERYSQALLYFKGYQAVQCHRVSHWLWLRGRRVLALALQCQMTEVFHVDIHPAAVLGRGMLLDHATGVVIGETAVVGDNVSMLHKVTLGGSGTARTGVRHPTVGHGVLLGAGVIVLGPVMVGAGSKVGAGSVVVSDLPAHSVAVGIPAKVIRRNASSEPVQDMDQVGGYIFDFVI